jgi:hypothetical protein
MGWLIGRHVKDPISNKCFLVIEHDKEHYVGCLIFDDAAFCSQISNLLEDQIGRSVKEIGDFGPFLHVVVPGTPQTSKTQRRQARSSIRSAVFHPFWMQSICSAAR